MHKLLVCALVAAATGCARTSLWTVDDCVGNCGDLPPGSWGDFAATLDVPECPSSNPVLTVNTTADELDGGQSITDPSQAGDYLSFVEAIWIAANRGTPHNIYFDAEGFSAANPGRITIGTDPEFAFVGARPELCLDGRRRGVVVEFAGLSGCAGDSCLWNLAPGSLMTGMTLVLQPTPLNATGIQVAGCRFLQPRGTAAVRVTFTEGALIGPGNVFAGGSWGVEVQAPSGGNVAIQESYFGYDPIAGPVEPPFQAVLLFAPAQLTDNVFVDVPITASIQPSATGTFSTFERNHFGEDRHGVAVGTVRNGFSVVGGGHVRFGEGNVVRNCAGSAVGSLLSDDASVLEITANLLTGCAEGITFGPLTPHPAAPVITGASATRVTGACDTAGRIEVFSDPGDQGEQFLGDVTCNGVDAWTLDTSVPRGRNVTATLTDAQSRTSSFSSPYAVP